MQKMTAATKFALILVDIQNDFMESGSLPVPRASCILPTVNELLEKLKGIVIATQVRNLPLVRTANTLTLSLEGLAPRQPR